MADQRPNGHIDDEALAAFVDGALGPDERAAVELHLAACDRCQMAFAEIVRTVEGLEADPAAARVDVADIPQPAPAPVAPPAPRRLRLARWVYAGGGLAAAAAIVLAVWMPRQREKQFQGAVDALVMAAGDERPITLRTASIDFMWGRRPAVQRSEGSRHRRPELEVAAGAIERLVDRTAGAPAAAAVALLAVGDVDDAITRLEGLRTRMPSASVLIDLSAAYFERYLRSGAPKDLDQARVTAVDATDASPDAAAAWFNLAVIEHARGNAAGTRVALTKYLSMDSQSPWAMELKTTLGSGAP